ncbi:MAG: hypothetical protein KDB07_13335 [Planctomycetes bacterium]|nr:hypothetical protein [Planctomycetota bacterium]
MGFKRLLVTAALIVFVALVLVSWLLPIVFRIAAISFAIVVIYVGVRILVGPTTPVPEDTSE